MVVFLVIQIYNLLFCILNIEIDKVIYRVFFIFFQVGNGVVDYVFWGCFEDMYMQRFVYKCIVFNGGCSDVEGIMVVVLVVGFMVFKVFGVYCQFENFKLGVNFGL